MAQVPAFLGSPGDVAGVLRRLSERHGLLSEPRKDATATLADLAGFAGSLRLGDVLATERPDREALEVRADDGRFLRAEAVHRLDSLGRYLDRIFRDPYRGGQAVADAKGFLAALQKAGIPDSRSERACEAAAERLTRPFREKVLRGVRRVRTETLRIRLDIAPGLRALSPRAAELERLDEAFRLATHGPSEKKYDLVGQRLDEALTAGLTAAVATLPDAIDEDVLAPWFAPGGFVHAHLADCRRLTTAVYEDERGLLMALIDGCIPRPGGSRV